VICMLSLIKICFCFCRSVAWRFACVAEAQGDVQLITGHITWKHFQTSHVTSCTFPGPNWTSLRFFCTNFNISNMAKRPTNTRPEQTAPAKKAKTVLTAAPKGILKKANGASTSIGSKNAAAKVEHQEVKNNGDRKGKGKATGSSVLRLPPTPAAPPKPATAFEIVAGSYERILYGLHCTPSGAGSDTSVDMQPVFQFPAHLTGVKCASASPNGRWLATGSTDEVVKVWDLRRRKEVGGLIGHEGEQLPIWQMVLE
jgi:hypothetical protein